MYMLWNQVLWNTLLEIPTYSFSYLKLYVFNQAYQIALSSVKYN